MNLINLSDNRCFWKTVKPFLSDKGSYISKINLVNKDEVISDDSTLAETFCIKFAMVCLRIVFIIFLKIQEALII